MRRGRKPSNVLSYRDKKIVERLNTTFDTMPQLAKKYGITKQRVYEILIRAKQLGYVVNRPKLLKRYHGINQCEVCNKILQVSRKSELITKRQLIQILNVEYKICNWHLNQLKRAGYLARDFATLRSDNIIKAIHFYKSSSLTINAVGKMFGYKNFYSILNYLKQKGMRLEREWNQL
jgi:hypothetical protein